MPPRAKTGDPACTQVMETPWFSKLKARRVTPNPTTKNLKEQCQYKVLRNKRKAATTASTHTHQEKAQALLARPLTHATKVETIKMLTNMPSTATALHTQLERHLGHRVEDLPIHRGGTCPLTDGGGMPDSGKHPPSKQTLCGGYASKHAAPHATSHPRVHNIQTPGEKVVPYHSAQPRAPSDVTMECQSPTGVAPAKVLA